MASVVDVCNRALQLIGASPIATLLDKTASARACNLAYPIVRQSELRKYDWNFAIARAQLAADVPAPTWGRSNSFTLPADYLKLTNGYPELLTVDANIIGSTVAFTASFSGQKDWVIEGKQIFTNDSGPLNVRYIKDVTDTTMWDSIFVEVMAAALGLNIAEALTQSNTKKADVAQAYKSSVEEGKKQSSIEVAPADSPPDTWLVCRS